MLTIPSEVGDHRLWLFRDITQDSQIFATWIMLNPSSASWETRDPTDKKVVGFSARAGYGGAYLGNLYTRRATCPKDIWPMLGDCNRPEANNALCGMIDRSDVVVVAWGAGSTFSRDERRAFGGRIDDVMGMTSFRDKPVYCLGVTKSGEPRHPLYVPYKQELVPYNRRLAA